MTDRFSAQLRKHLVESANERAGDGQLAAVVQGIATTTQRRPLAARLAGKADRVGPIVSVGLRFGLVVLALIGAMVAVAIFGSNTKPAPRTTVFEGSWTTTDNPDGSTLTLRVGAGHRPVLRFIDDNATGGACVDDPVRLFTASGTGLVVGNRLTTSFPDGGGCGSMVVDVIIGAFDYSSGTNTLRDAGGAIWSWVPGVPPLQSAPATLTGPDSTDTTGSPSPNTEPRCFDIPAGMTYRSTVPGDVPSELVGLGITVPATATFTWQGYRDRFEVAQSCTGARRVEIRASVVQLVIGACGHNGGRPPSAAKAVEWLTTSDELTTTEPTQVTIAGYAAWRFEIVSTTCDEDAELWNDSGVGVRSDATVFIVDVDPAGVPLGISVENQGGDDRAAQLAEAEALVMSMEISP